MTRLRELMEAVATTEGYALVPVEWRHATDEEYAAYRAAGAHPAAPRPIIPMWGDDSHVIRDRAYWASSGV